MLSHHPTSVTRLVLVRKSLRPTSSPFSSFHHVFFFPLSELANLAENNAVGIKCRALRDQFALEV